MKVYIHYTIKLCFKLFGLIIIKDAALCNVSNFALVLTHRHTRFDTHTHFIFYFSFVNQDGNYISQGPVQKMRSNEARKVRNMKTFKSSLASPDDPKPQLLATKVMARKAN